MNTDCRNCYAKNLAATRLSGPGQPYHGLAVMRKGKAYWTGVMQLVDDMLMKPMGWTRPRKVFVNSMSDLFHDGLTDEQIDQVVAVMALSPLHQFQVLTKRPERMLAYLQRCAAGGHHDAIQAAIDLAPRGWKLHGAPYAWPLPNVWWGVSMGHQDAADEFLPFMEHLRRHAAVLWVSAEPLTERMTLGHFIQFIDWLVAGGESGKEARPMHPAWPKALQREAELAGRAFHFKQWGEWLPVTYLEPNRQAPMLNIGCGMNGRKERVVSSGSNDHHDDINMRRVGKKVAGRLLDGKQWDQWPIQAGVFERIS